jgi:polysaccharide biosynthesis transport protein
VVAPDNGNGGGHETGRGNNDVQSNGRGKLTLLTCGKHIHYGSELLDSASFPKLMEGLRQQYQRIILDTPPVLGLSETAVIQRFADGVLLVIWSENTAMRNVQTALQTLQTNGAKFIGFVLNRLDFSTLTNRYKYFYYSPYYYHRYKAIDLPSSATGT